MTLRLALLAQGGPSRLAPLAQGGPSRLALLAQGGPSRLALLAQGRPSRLAPRARTLLALLWMAAAIVTWNIVFDAHIVKGARDYVDRQQRFVEGRGPRLDMEQAMTAARSAGVTSASMWTAGELLAGAVAWRLLARRRQPAASPPRRESRFPR